MASMTRKQFDFYFSRIRLFHNPSQIADMLGVSRPTVDTWEAKRNLPRASMLPEFERVLRRVFDRLTAIGFNEVVEALDVEPPKPITQQVSWSPKAVRRWLFKYLSKPRDFGVIMMEASRLGITKSQVQYAAKKLGVKKKYRGTIPTTTEWLLT